MKIQDFSVVEVLAVTGVERYMILSRKEAREKGFPMGGYGEPIGVWAVAVDSNGIANMWIEEPIPLNLSLIEGFRYGVDSPDLIHNAFMALDGRRGVQAKNYLMKQWSLFHWL